MKQEKENNKEKNNEKVRRHQSVGPSQESLASLMLFRMSTNIVERIKPSFVSYL